MDSKSHSESCKLNVYSSDLNVFSSPSISDSYSQMKKKVNLPEDLTVLDNFGRTEMNLKRSGKHATRSQFVSETTIPENILTVQDWKVSGNPSSPTFNIESKLAIDNPNSFNTSNSNINRLLLKQPRELCFFLSP